MDMLNLGIAIVIAVTLNIIDNPPAKFRGLLIILWCYPVERTSERNKNHSLWSDLEEPAWC